MGRSLVALALAVALATTLASCGGSSAELLPGETAREITANLEKVGQLAGEGDCVGASSAANEIGEQIEALGGIDPKLKQALIAGAERLDEAVASCEEEPAEAISPSTTELEEPEEKEPAEKKEGKEKKPGKEETVTPPAGETNQEEPPLPPQANGEGKGLGNGNGPPEGETEGEGAPSGGVGPGAPVESE